MVFLLALLSFIAVAAGVFGLGLGVPIRETWFGAALLMTGSVAVTGGLILMGLAAVVYELRQIGQGFKAPASGMPLAGSAVGAQGRVALRRCRWARCRWTDGVAMRMPVPLHK